jgi:hypothetical protein
MLLDWFSAALQTRALGEQIKIEAVKNRFMSIMVNYMNPFLEELFNTIAIDAKYLYGYLTPDEMKYLNISLKSREDLNSDDFYTSEHGSNLEALLFFLVRNLKDIKLIWEDRNRKEVLLRLYTSNAISGNYDCFHFDLSKFEQTFIPKGQELTLYRIGRTSETIENVGNSWAEDTTGLKNYAQASSIEVDNRPIFSIKINDSEVLCLGKPEESEFILKKYFQCSEIKLLKAEERSKIFI